MALDADTGKVVWEYKFNIFQSDVPPHRVGWASPAADPETGNVYALGVGATVVALSSADSSLCSAACFATLASRQKPTATRDAPRAITATTAAVRLAMAASRRVICYQCYPELDSIAIIAA